MFSSLKNGCSFCFHFWAFSRVFLPDFPGSYAMQYNRAANFTARTTKNFPKIQKKFPGVPAKISRCSMNSFGLCHEIIWPVILKSFGLSQDLPLSQNGQNLRRGELGNRAKRIDGANGANEANGATEATEPTGANGRWSRTKRLRGLSRPIVLICPAKSFRKNTEGAFLHPLNI